MVRSTTTRKVNETKEILKNKFSEKEFMKMEMHSQEIPIGNPKYFIGSRAAIVNHRPPSPRTHPGPGLSQT